MEENKEKSSREYALEWRIEKLKKKIKQMEKIGFIIFEVMLVIIVILAFLAISSHNEIYHYEALFEEYKGMYWDLYMATKP